MKTSSLGFVAAATVLLCIAAPREVTAQWGLSLELQRAAFGGTSHDTSTGGTHGSFRPGNTPGITLRFGRRLGRIDLGLGMRYSRSSVVLDNGDLIVGFHNELATIEVAPEVLIRVAHTQAGANLHVYASPVIGICVLKDNGTRVVPGAMAGVAGEFPLLHRLALWVRVGGGLARSVFREGELPPDFELHLARRSEIGLGLRYGR